MEKQQIIDYVMHNPDNTNPAVLSDLLDQLDTGGDSRFSTAKVTFTNKSDTVQLSVGSVVYINDNWLYGVSSEWHPIAANTTATMEIVLFNGQETIIVITAEEDITLTGNITLSQTQKWGQTYEHRCTVTGDGTISGTGIKPV